MNTFTPPWSVLRAMLKRVREIISWEQGNQKEVTTAQKAHHTRDTMSTTTTDENEWSEFHSAL
jgi:primase-polymerase (primpol)-like protein